MVFMAVPLVFGRNLRQLRKRYRISRQCLGRLTGLSTREIRRIETASTPVDLDMQLYLHICHIFGVNPDNMVKLEL